ncbi:MAG: hypothetical protein R3C10_22645 [Pirellulales bacterium]
MIASRSPRSDDRRAVPATHRPHGRRACWAMLLVLAVFSASGASCPRVVEQYTMAPVFVDDPTADEIIRTVNENSGRVHSLTGTASVGMDGMPSVKAVVALERPRRLRLTAKMLGPIVDLGSNDEMFWMWTRQPEPSTIYFCSHAAYRGSGVRNVMPVEPQWLIEAIGLAYFNPDHLHEGPYPVGEDDELFEMQTTWESGGEQYRRVLTIDRKARVLGQSVFDADGNVLARAAASDHKRYIVEDVVLPRTVKIAMPRTGLAITLEMDEVKINPPDEIKTAMWSMPQYAGSTSVNLAEWTPPPTAIAGPLSPPTDDNTSPDSSPPRPSPPVRQPYVTFDRTVKPVE